MWTADDDRRLMRYVDEAAYHLQCDAKQVARRVRHLVLDQ